jgi:lycopene beta-cyclase
LELVPAHVSKKDLNYELLRFDVVKRKAVDLVVVGAGPAGLAVAHKVAEAGVNVCVVDPAPQSVWPNNYGVWVDEFEDLDLLDCLDYTWASAVVYLDDAKEKTLERPYGRVNRTRLKSKMLEACIANGVQFHKAKVKDVDHNPSKSFVTCEDGTLIEAAVVLDATGHSRRLVKYDKPFNPGYQIAYGIVAEVDSHPFDVNKMLFMDWRDSHLHGNKELMEANSKLPTFLYAMPFSANHIFLEETSLVARPGVPMDVIQKRMELRLKHLGIHVRSIEEDEKCVIPMGGVLPVIPQRVLGIGGTAGMVHPSTGYMVARTLAAAPTLAESVLQRLGGSASTHIPSRPQNPPNVESSAPAQEDEALSFENGSGPTGDELAAGVWASLWPLERQQQRAFFCFGMEVLLKLDLAGTRRFFDAFFDLQPHHWQGFLSSRLYFMELIGFGLSLFKHATNYARAEIIAIGTVPLARLILDMTQMKPPKGSS